MGQGSIIETAAHADAMAVAVETDQRQDDEVESAWFEEVASAPKWLRNGEAVEAQTLSRAESGEPEPSASPLLPNRADDRQIARLTGFIRKGECRPWVDFAIRWPIKGNAFGGQERAVVRKSPGQQGGVQALCRRIECSTSRAQFGSREAGECHAAGLGTPPIGAVAGLCS